MTHTCRIATARINYIGRPNERVLNTTMKTGKGLGAVFAPTRRMVLDSKNGIIDWETYTARYTGLMRERYRANRGAFLEALGASTLVLCCYCRDTHATTRHCHRYLLEDILVKIANHHGFCTVQLLERRN